MLLSRPKNHRPGYSGDDSDSTADKAFVAAAGWGGPNIWFARVPEGKTAKNRMHFDLRARVGRLLTGRPADHRRGPQGGGSQPWRNHIPMIPVGPGRLSM
jgi:hypothetical protein